MSAASARLAKLGRFEARFSLGQSPAQLLGFKVGFIFPLKDGRVYTTIFQREFNKIHLEPEN